MVGCGSVESHSVNLWFLRWRRFLQRPFDAGVCEEQHVTERYLDHGSLR